MGRLLALHRPSVRGMLIAVGWIPLLACGALSVAAGSADGHVRAPAAAIRLPDSPHLSASFPGRTRSRGARTAPQTAAHTQQLLSVLLAHIDRPPRYLMPIYQRAGSRYGVPWQVLAAINAIETDSGRDLAGNPEVGLGWMRFVPRTWPRYAVAADHRSDPVPYDPHDAILTAARYLADKGAAHDLPRALFAYNHAEWYVQAVLREAASIGGPASWRHIKPSPEVAAAGRGAAASSITLSEAIAVSRSSHTTALASVTLPSFLIPVSGAVVPQTPWNPQLKPIAGWIVPVLQWAAAHGWTGLVVSGYRTYAEQAAINAMGLFSAPAGSSNHETTAYPGGAVDVTNPRQLIGVLRAYPGPFKLIGGVLGPIDPEHFSATGH